MLVVPPTEPAPPALLPPTAELFPPVPVELELLPPVPVLLAPEPPELVPDAVEEPPVPERTVVVPVLPPALLPWFVPVPGCPPPILAPPPFVSVSALPFGEQAPRSMAAPRTSNASRDECIGSLPNWVGASFQLAKAACNAPQVVTFAFRIAIKMVTALEASIDALCSTRFDHT